MILDDSLNLSELLLIDGVYSVAGTWIAHHRRFIPIYRALRNYLTLPLTICEHRNGPLWDLKF